MRDLCIVMLCFISLTVHAEVFFSVDEVKRDYLEKVLKEETDRRVPLKIEKVKYQEKDINGDGKLDLAVFDYYHCGSSTGCRGDIYLCRSGSEACSLVGYCFAARVMEKELVNKGKGLMCNE